MGLRVGTTRALSADGNISPQKKKKDGLMLSYHSKCLDKKPNHGRTKAKQVVKEL